MGNEKLAFGSMTFPILAEKYGIRLATSIPLFEDCPPVEPTPILVANVRRGRRATLVNERARAYWLIAPVMAELDELRAGKIQALPETALAVEGTEGLTGIPDFVISAGNVRAKVIPIVAIVEAKHEDIEGGLPVCLAELYAAHLVNGKRPRMLHGCVTSGMEWKFVRLEADAGLARVDLDTYAIGDLPRLLGNFCRIVDTALAELADLMPPP
jgi:hypothetical protein